MSRVSTSVLPRAVGGALVVAALAFVAGPASAQQRRVDDAELELIEREVGQLERRYGALRAELSGGGLSRSPRLISERIAEGTYAYLTDNYERCALVFYSLLENADLQGDPRKDEAEWYLAECLFLDGNYIPAQGQFRKIVDSGATHRFYGDSLLKLIELYGRTGDTNQFNNYYNNFIRQAQDGSPTSLRIRYEMGKSLFRQGKFVEAQGILGAFPRGSTYTPQARYFSAAIHVRDGAAAAEAGDKQSAEQKYRHALTLFAEVLTLPVSTDEQREVMDLTRLATARLHYELGDIPSAIAAYSSIPSDSGYYVDALYEVIWANIERKQFEDALRGIEIFNLAFPGDIRDPALKLLAAHVRVRMEQWDQAVTRYRSAADDFRALKTRVDEILGSAADPMVFFNQLVDSERYVASADMTVPDEALDRARVDDRVDGAVRVASDLYRQQDDIVASTELLQQLGEALDRRAQGDLLQTYRLHRQQLESVESATLVLRSRALDFEVKVLRASLPAGSEAAVDAMQSHQNAAVGAAANLAQQQRDDLARAEAWGLQAQAVGTRIYHLELLIDEQKETLRAIEEYLVGARARNERTREQEMSAREAIDAERAELDQWTAELRQLKRRVDPRTLVLRLGKPADTKGASIDEARASLDAMESRTASARRSASGADEWLRRIDAIRSRLADLDRQGSESRSRLVTEEAKEIEAVRKELDFQTRMVASLDGEAKTINTANVSVSGRLGKQAFRDVGAYYEDMLARADMGVIDVFWYRKEQISGDKKKLARERARRLESLEDAFRSVLEEVE